MRPLQLRQRTNTAATDPPATAVLPIEVRDRNLDGITVKLVPSFDVQGVVKFAPAARCDASGMTVGLSPAPGISYGGYVRAAQIGSDSRFTLKNVGPFTYTVNLMNAGPCYVQSVQYAGKEVAGFGPVHGCNRRPGNHPRGVQRDGARNRGGRRRRLSAARLGDAHAQRRPVFLFPPADSSTDFTFSSLPPGTYEVFAWERVDTSAARSPEFLKQFESRAKVVTVEADGSTRIQLTAIPASETTDPDSPVPAQPPRAEGSLEGRVVEAGSSEPLKYASVVLRNMSGPMMTSSGLRENVAEADEEGRFAFPDLEPGSYSIQARRPGFVAVGAVGPAA